MFPKFIVSALKTFINLRKSYPNSSFFPFLLLSLHTWSTIFLFFVNLFYVKCIRRSFYTEMKLCYNLGGEFWDCNLIKTARYDAEMNLQRLSEELNQETYSAAVNKTNLI